MAITLNEITSSARPDRMVLLVGADEDTELLAYQAVHTAQSRMPKVSGYLAQSLQPLYGTGFFGIYFPDKRVWYLERGIKPFTMKNLHGIIPMWIEDPTGSERKANPKARTRRTQDGRTQILIFRFVGRKGTRKQIRRRNTSTNTMVNVVRKETNYPGAPGRIGRRQVAAPRTNPGKVGGQIAGGNVGVKWRHPGITARMFLNSAIASTALDHGIDLNPLHVVDEQSFYTLLKR